MSTPAEQRTLASLMRDEAPLPPRRAAAVMLAVCGELERTAASGTDPGGAPPGPPGSGPTADEVLLHADGSVGIRRPGPLDVRACGALAGRWLHELLVGRPPLGSEDAFEPHLVASLDPPTIALLARSCSPSPGQWPDVRDWSVPLGRIAGGQATPTPPARAAALHRRRILVAVAVLALLALSVAIVALAPRWWDATAGDDAGFPVTITSSRTTALILVDPQP